MSFDVWLEIDAGGEEPVSVGGYDLNITYNIAPMVREAWGLSINDFDKMSACTVGDTCREIVAKLTAEPEKYEAMNPPNGWGSRKELIEFLTQLRMACDAAPFAKVRVC